MSARAKTLGVTSAAVAVSTGAALVAQRQWASRLRRIPDPEAREQLGSLHLPGCRISAEDGVPLYAELVANPDQSLAVIFVHGFALSMDSWHYQRRDLGDLGRLVFYDQRGHGASGRGAPELATLTQLGRDLATVLDVLAADAPVILVGHSLGGMTIMALAEQRPELFGSRVVGVALISTAAGRVTDSLFGVPPAVGRLLRVAAPLALPRVARNVALLERGRTVSADLSFLLTRHFAFGRPVPASLVDFVEGMLAATPVEVMLEFLPTFGQHDRRAALAGLRDVEVLVLSGGRDALLPASRSAEIAELLPHAQAVTVADAGHMVILERPALVNLHLRAFVHRAARRASLK